VLALSGAALSGSVRGPGCWATQAVVVSICSGVLLLKLLNDLRGTG